MLAIHIYLHDMIASFWHAKSALIHILTNVSGVKLIMSCTKNSTIIRKALFQELTDEIAISNQGRENLIFAVGSLPYENRTAISYSKEEFVLKCSFNQKDCDIEKFEKLNFTIFHL